MTHQQSGSSSSDLSWKQLSGMSYDQQEALYAPVQLKDGGGGPDKGTPTLKGDGKDKGDGKGGGGKDKPKTPAFDIWNLTEAQKDALVTLFTTEDKAEAEAAAKDAKGAGVPDDVINAFVTRNKPWFKETMDKIGQLTKADFFSAKFDPATGEFKNRFNIDDKNPALEWRRFGLVGDVKDESGYMRFGEEGSDKEVRIGGGGDIDGGAGGYVQVGQEDSKKGQHTSKVIIKDGVTAEHGHKKVTTTDGADGNKRVTTDTKKGSGALDVGSDKKTGDDGQEVVERAGKVKLGYEQGSTVENVTTDAKGKEKKETVYESKTDAGLTAGNTLGGNSEYAANYNTSTKTKTNERSLDANASHVTTTDDAKKTKTETSKAHFGKTTKDTPEVTLVEGDDCEITATVSGPRHSVETDADLERVETVKDNTDGGNTTTKKNSLKVGHKDDFKGMKGLEKEGKAGNLDLSSTSNQTTNADGEVVSGDKTKALTLNRSSYEGDASKSESLTVSTTDKLNADGTLEDSRKLTHTKVEKTGDRTKTDKRSYTADDKGSTYTASHRDQTGDAFTEQQLDLGDTKSGQSMTLTDTRATDKTHSTMNKGTVYTGDKEGLEYERKVVDGDDKHHLKTGVTSVDDADKGTTKTNANFSVDNTGKLTDTKASVDANRTVGDDGEVLSKDVTASAGLTTRRTKTDEDGFAVVDKKGNAVTEEVFDGTITFKASEGPNKEGQQTSATSVTLNGTVRDNTTANISLERTDTEQDDGRHIKVDQVKLDVGSTLKETELEDGTVKAIKVQADGVMAQTTTIDEATGDEVKPVTFDAGVKLVVTKGPKTPGGKDKPTVPSSTFEISLRGGRMASSGMPKKFGLDKQPNVLGQNPAPFGQYGGLDLSYKKGPLDVGFGAQYGQVGQTNLLQSDFHLKMQRWSTKASISAYQQDDEWRGIVDATSDFTAKNGITVGVGTHMSLDPDKSEQLMWHFAKFGYKQGGDKGTSIMLTAGALKDGEAPFVYPVGLDVSAGGFTAQAVTVFGQGSPNVALNAGYQGVKLFGGYGDPSQMGSVGPGNMTGMGVPGVPATGTGLYGMHGGSGQGSWYFGVSLTKNISDLLPKVKKYSKGKIDPKPMDY